MPVNIKADTFDSQKYGMYEGKVKADNSSQGRKAEPKGEAHDR